METVFSAELFRACASNEVSILNVDEATVCQASFFLGKPEMLNVHHDDILLLLIVFAILMTDAISRRPV